MTDTDIDSALKDLAKDLVKHRHLWRKNSDEYFEPYFTKTFNRRWLILRDRITVTGSLTIVERGLWFNYTVHNNPKELKKAYYDQLSKFDSHNDHKAEKVIRRGCND